MLISRSEKVAYRIFLGRILFSNPRVMKTMGSSHSNGVALGNKPGCQYLFAQAGIIQMIRSNQTRLSHPAISEYFGLYVYMVPRPGVAVVIHYFQDDSTPFERHVKWQF